MFSFDSLTLKYFYEENLDFINGAIVQKIQLPSRHEIILNIRNLNFSQNKKLYININPKYPHICFIDEKTSAMRDIQIPKSPPAFCMQLRKYLSGSKIKDFKLLQYERILELYFDYFDEIGSLTKMCLAFEFMGKHSNVILYNSQNKFIVGSIHNISAQKSSVREIYGGVKYIYPPQKEKLDILKISYSTFYEIAKEFDVKKISDNFYYLSQAILNFIFGKKMSLEVIFQNLQKLQNGQKKELLCEFWGEEENINLSIDNYFSKIMFEEILKNKKLALKKYLQNDVKKISKIDFNISKTYEKYKLYADLLLANMYSGLDLSKEKVVIDGCEIELDNKISINDNIQKYYQLYKKKKTAYEITQKRLIVAKEKLEYFESIIFNIENAKNYDELKQIKEELIEIGLIASQQKEKVNIKIEKTEFLGFDIYIGKNNKQNDYLISKIANGEDLWFHGQGFPSSHVVLKIPNNKKQPSAVVLEYCAKLVKENSKAKNSGKTSIIYTKRKNLKKPPNTYLGYVTYKNEVEIIIE